MEMRFHILAGFMLILPACTPVAPIIPTSTPFISPTPSTIPTAVSTPTWTATSTPQATVPPGPICLKIMPLGDSITFGEPGIGYGGYRNLLGTLLKNDGYIVDFVGSQKNGEAIIPDPDNEGHPGWKILNIKDGIDLDGWLETYRPDIILLHIGSNDVRVGNAAYAPENLSALLDDILLRLPETQVIVAQIIPYSSGPLRGHQSFNDAIPGIVTSKGPHVSMVDMQNILSHSDYADTYHPNAQGYDKMAQAWKTAIFTLESLPDRTCSPE